MADTRPASSPPFGAVTRLATGFTFTEGPVWDPVGETLLFSDMPGDLRRRWDPVTGVTVVRSPSNKCNGMAYEATGALLVCEHATSRLVREHPDGTVETVASHYGGRELNSPNDVVVAHDGTIYFSDPTYGRTPGFGVERPLDLDHRGLYRATGDPTAPELLHTDFDQPNGLCLSPDETTLYVNDTVRGAIFAFPRSADGGLGSPALFAEGVAHPDYEGWAVDGMKCDADGNVWVSAPRGIWVFDPAGQHVASIEVPEIVGNLNWGGPEWSQLFITASTSLYVLQTQTRGAHVPNMARVSDGAVADPTEVA